MTLDLSLLEEMKDAKYAGTYQLLMKQRGYIGFSGTLCRRFWSHSASTKSKPVNHRVGQIFGASSPSHSLDMPDEFLQRKKDSISTKTFRRRQLSKRIFDFRPPSFRKSNAFRIFSRTPRIRRSGSTSTSSMRCRGSRSSVSWMFSRFTWRRIL